MNSTKRNQTVSKETVSLGAVKHPKISLSISLSNLHLFTLFKLDHIYSLRPKPWVGGLLCWLEDILPVVYTGHALPEKSLKKNGVGVHVGSFTTIRSGHSFSSPLLSSLIFINLLDTFSSPTTTSPTTPPPSNHTNTRPFISVSGSK